MQVSVKSCYGSSELNDFREFDPSFNAVAKAWSTVSASERDNHFFATLDFDEATPVFQKVGNRQIL